MKNKFLTRQLAALLMTAAVLSGSAFAGVTQVTEVSAASKISETKARNIAVNDARARTGEIMALDIYEDDYKGQDVYTISFYVQHGSDTSRKFTHYKYEVNLHTGHIEKRSSRDLTVIAPKTAIKKALDKADVSSSRVKEKYLDYGEDGENLVYNISFSVPVSYYNYSPSSAFYKNYLLDGTVDYQFVINAVTGKIIDWDSDTDFEEYYY